MSWASTAVSGIQLVSRIIPAITQVEQLQKAIPLLKGPDAENAAVLIAKDGLEIADAVTGKTLLDEPAVEAAARAFIQAYVALQNVLASVKKPAPAPAS